MRWDGMSGRNFDFKDGDKFMWRGRELATLVHHDNGDCKWWTIQAHDEGEREMFLGYDKDLPQKTLDDICQVYYSALVTGIVYTRKTEEAAFASIPCSK